MADAKDDILYVACLIEYISRHTMIWVSKANSVKRAWQCHQVARTAEGRACIAGRESGGE